jgi:hypothetical protein
MVSGVASIGGDTSWPELGFAVFPAKSKREKRWGGGGRVLGFLAATDVAL